MRRDDMILIATLVTILTALLAFTLAPTIRCGAGCGVGQQAPQPPTTTATPASEPVLFEKRGIIILDEADADFLRRAMDDPHAPMFDHDRVRAVLDLWEKSGQEPPQPSQPGSNKPSPIQAGRQSTPP